jgi:hypothetical protein
MVMSDVSASGAFIAGDVSDLAKGDEVVLSVSPEIAFVATVIWAHETGCGLTFHRRLTSADLDSVIALGTLSKKQAAGRDPLEQRPSPPMRSRYSNLI